MRTDPAGLHEIDCRLAEAFPEVAREERVMGRARVLQNFEDDDLLERP